MNIFLNTGELLPRKSTSDEVREHKTSLQNVNIAPTPKPATNHISTPLVGNHTNTHTAPRLSTHVAPPAHTQPTAQPVLQPVVQHVAQPVVQPQKQTTFAPTTTAPPQPAPRKFSQTNGQVRRDYFLHYSQYFVEIGTLD